MPLFEGCDACAVQGAVALRRRWQLFLKSTAPTCCSVVVVLAVTAKSQRCWHQGMCHHNIKAPRGARRVRGQRSGRLGCGARGARRGRQPLLCQAPQHPRSGSRYLIWNTTNYFSTAIHFTEHPAVSPMRLPPKIAPAPAVSGWSSATIMIKASIYTTGAKERVDGGCPRFVIVV